MEIEHIREFICLAKNLNYTSTSDQLFVTQSSLTRHIAKIEAELGLQLFSRSPHNVSLTDSGVLALAAFEDIIVSYDKLLADIKINAAGFSGNIKIGMLYYAIDNYYAPMLTHYNKHHSNIKLDLYSYQPPFVLEALINKKIDIGFLFRGDYPEANKLTFHSVATEKPALMYSANNPRLKNKKSVLMKDFIGEKLICIESHIWLNHLIQSALGENFALFSDIVPTEHIDTLPLTIMETNGIAIVEEHLISALTRKGICYAVIEDINLTLDACLVTLKNSVNPAVEDYITTAKTILPSA